jgi:hypothetical protein
MCGTEIGVGVANTYAHVDVRGRYDVWTYFDDDAEDRRAKAEVDAHRGRLRAGGGGGGTGGGAKPCTCR